MTDICKILLGSFVTVISGTAVYVITRLFVDKLLDIRKLTPKIINTIIRYRLRIVNPPGLNNDHIMEAKTQLRELAIEIFSTVRAISYYSFFASIKSIIKRRELEEVANKLNKLAANISIRDHGTRQQLDLPAANLALVNEIGRIIDFRFDPLI